MHSAIIISAGFSSRFNSPKALAKIGSQLVVNRLIDSILNAQIPEIIVVLGASAEKIKPEVLKHTAIKIVYNKDYILGQTSSVRYGLRHAYPKSQSYLIFPVDCPLITSETISHLVRHFNKNSCDLLIPQFNSKSGHPPVFNSLVKMVIEDSDNSIGLNVIFKNNSFQKEFVSINDPGICQSFNTVDEFTAILENRSH